MLGVRGRAGHDRGDDILACRDAAGTIIHQNSGALALCKGSPVLSGLLIAIGLAGAASANRLADPFALLDAGGPLEAQDAAGFLPVDAQSQFQCRLVGACDDIELDR